MRAAAAVVSLATRPVLFALARALAEAWPADVSRDALIARAFRAKRADESHRARLRVEIGAAARALRALADVDATTRGFALAPRRAREVVVLARPVEEEHAAVLAFLADGESWSSSALALALGTSQRTVQRALDALAARGKVQSFGRGRARRWMTPPLPGFTTTLLLPASAAGLTRMPAHESSMNTAAEIIREYGPFPGVDKVHGVTFDGQQRLVRLRRQAERPRSGERQARCARSTSPRMPARRSTASTCSRSPRTASRRSIRRPAACSPRSRRPATAAIPGWPGPKARCGSAQYRDRKIHQVDPETGAILRTIESNRFVTGVTWVDGELWHGTWEGDESELRRIDPRNRRGAGKLEMPAGAGVSGLESDGARPLLLRRRHERQGARRAAAEARPRQSAVNPPGASEVLRRLGE